MYNNNVLFGIGSTDQQFREEAAQVELVNLTNCIGKEWVWFSKMSWTWLSQLPALELMELKNVFRLITFHVNSDRAVIGFSLFVCEKGVAEWKEIICLLQRRERFLDFINTEMWKLGSSYPDMTELLHVRLDLPLVNIEDITRSQVLTGTVEGN